MASFGRSLGGIRTQHMGTCLQQPSHLQLMQDLVFSHMLPPTCLQRIALYHVQSPPKFNIYTSLGGSARVGIYIQVALGTKQIL